MPLFTLHPSSTHAPLPRHFHPAPLPFTSFHFVSLHFSPLHLVSLKLHSNHLNFIFALARQSEWDCALPTMSPLTLPNCPVRHVQYVRSLSAFLTFGSLRFCPCGSPFISLLRTAQSAPLPHPIPLPPTQPVHLLFFYTSSNPNLYTDATRYPSFWPCCVSSQSPSELKSLPIHLWRLRCTPALARASSSDVFPPARIARVVDGFS